MDAIPSPIATCSLSAPSTTRSFSQAPQSRFRFPRGATTGSVSARAALPYSSRTSTNAPLTSPAPPYSPREPQRQAPSTLLQAIKIDRSKPPTPQDTILSDSDLDECPVECVREIKTRRDLATILEYADRRNILVVIDFYRTACGSCKYIEQGFIKLCRAEGDMQHPVMFFKHNVMDDYEEQSEIAEDLKIKAVPLFHFYLSKNLVEAFPTRDKARILETIQKYVPNFETDDEFMASDDE